MGHTSVFALFAVLAVLGHFGCFCAFFEFQHGNLGVLRAIVNYKVIRWIGVREGAVLGMSSKKIFTQS